MATVVIAPDGFGGTLSAGEAADAIATGWRRVRPDDVIRRRPLSDGGEGLLDTLARTDDTWRECEVAGPRGTPVTARWLRRADGSALLESAQACGLHLLADDQRQPMHTTTWGVGQLIDAARADGATEITLGLGGSATVDGGAGALSGLGFRLRVADGSGLKIGGADLHRLARAERGWAADTAGLSLTLLADVRTPLHEAARRFAPQKGADAEQTEQLAAALVHLGEVLPHDLGTGHGSVSPTTPGTGAAGGLGFALAVALGARFVPGAAAVADLVDLDTELDAAEVVVTGEGRLDTTSLEGKVVAEVSGRAQRARCAVLAVVGQAEPGLAHGLDDLEVSAPDGP
ncbi:MAG: glycerate kinase, partial [Nitriliruptoraceae bacterium]|nr:glycerate kinase [Nitriliruptoraceae bacterium]